jgi:sulfate adenylyltransferase
MSPFLIPPHGGTLVHLMADASRRAELKSRSREWPSWTLTPRQLCDLELLLNGGFSPLQGFLGQRDYESVCETMQLPADPARRTEPILWPMPVQLDVPEALARTLHPSASLVLRDLEEISLAILHVEDIWKPDRGREAERVFGTRDPEHPGVAHLLQQTHPYYVGGRLEGLEMPRHYDYPELRLPPAQLRERFQALGWHRIAAFQPHVPMHRAQLELTSRALRELHVQLLIHPAGGMTEPGDLSYYTRVRCYRAILPYYPSHTALLNLLPLAMRMGGPREALWLALLHRNYGCSHLLMEKERPASHRNSHGQPLNDPGMTQDLLQKFQTELGIQTVSLSPMVYLPDRDAYVPEDEVPRPAVVQSLSETELRERLASGREIPSWFSFPEILGELHRAYPERRRQGFTVFFTGLPSSGKSTAANVLLVKLLERGVRPVTLLDGDIVRKHLSSELGFSQEHRDVHIRRIGFVAAEITKHGGIAICAPIAPYDQTRREVRKMIESQGGFLLVYVATPLEVCEQRDRKGMYARARAGILPQFTGISDPYEPPKDAEVVLDTTSMSPEEAASKILLAMEQAGYMESVE